VIFLNIQTGCRLPTGRRLELSPEQFRGLSWSSIGNDILVYWTVGFLVASSLLALATVFANYPVFRLPGSRKREGGDGDEAPRLQP
jgi:hypothetical protein